MHLSNFRYSYIGLMSFIFSYVGFVVLGGLDASESIYRYFNIIFYGISIFSILICLIKKDLKVYFFFFIWSILLFLVSVSSYSNYIDYIDLYKFLCFLCCGYVFYKYISDFDYDNLKKYVLWYNLFHVIVLSLSLNFDPLGRGYLFYAEGIVLLSFISVMLNKRSLINMFFFIFTIIVLYIVNSRSAIFFYIFVYFFSYYYLYGWKRSTLFSLPLIFGLIYSAIYINNSIDNYQEHRVLKIIFATEQDTSFNARLVVNEFGLKVFKENIITGDFGAYRPVFGEGMYAHNFVSYLAEFGIWGLILFGYCILIFLFILYRLFFVENKNKVNYFVFSCIVYSLLGTLLTKSYIWVFLYFTMGLCLAHMYNLKHVNKGAKF